MVYFICSTPGTLGNFIGRSVNALLSDQNAQIIVNPLGPNASPFFTPEFFYDNLQIPEEGTFIVNIPFRPDYEILKQKFPECKIIVITHLIQDITHISRAFFRHFFLESYEAGAEPHFRKIIEDHHWLFSSTFVTPEELTRTERDIFARIIAHQKLLDGFHNMTVPTDPDILRIRFEKIFYHYSEVEAQLENFTGKTFTEYDKSLNRELTQAFIQKYFSLLSY